MGPLAPVAPRPLRDDGAAQVLVGLLALVPWRLAADAHVHRDAFGIRGIEVEPLLRKLVARKRAMKAMST